MYSYWNLRLEQRHIFHPESGPPHPQVPVAALDVVHSPPRHLPLLLLLFLCKLNICLFIKHQYIPTIILSTAEHSSMKASLAASLLLSILSMLTRTVDSCWWPVCVDVSSRILRAVSCQAEIMITWVRVQIRLTPQTWWVTAQTETLTQLAASLDLDSRYSFLNVSCRSVVFLVIIFSLTRE